MSNIPKLESAPVIIQCHVVCKTEGSIRWVEGNIGYYSCCFVECRLDVAFLQNVKALIHFYICIHV